MGCIVLVPCVLVSHCGLAGVVWYPYAGSISGSICVGVALWFGLGCCGIRMQAEAVLQPAYGYHTTPAKPQRNTNAHRTRTIQPIKELIK